MLVLLFMGKLVMRIRRENVQDLAVQEPADVPMKQPPSGLHSMGEMTGSLPAVNAEDELPERMLCQ